MEYGSTATNHKSMYDDATNINRKTVNSNNAPIPRPRIYLTRLTKTEDKYQVLQQTKMENLSSSEKAYYGDAKELKARNETGYCNTSNGESLYEEVSIPSFILKTTSGLYRNSQKIAVKFPEALRNVCIYSYN